MKNYPQIQVALKEQNQMLKEEQLKSKLARIGFCFDQWFWFDQCMVNGKYQTKR